MPEHRKSDHLNHFIVGLSQFPNEHGTRLVHIKMGAGTMKQMGNLLVCGPPGAGKTNLIVSNLICWQHSAVVIDLKGTVYNLTANYRREIGQQVYVLDPRNGTGHRYNPVAATPKELWYELASELVSITNDDSFWSAVAISMWMACWYAAEHAKQPHIPYALEIMNIDGISGALRYFMENHKDDPMTMKHVRDFFNVTPEDPKLIEQMRNNPDRLLASKWTTVKNSTQPLDNPNFVNIFSGHDIDVEGMFYNGATATVYIMADETNKRQFNAFARLVMKSIGEALIRAGDVESTRRPVLFLYDEFGNAPLSTMLNWLTTMRSRDVILALFIQDLTQLNVDGKKHEFIQENSIHHHIFFKPLNPAGVISETISKMSGKTSKFVYSGVSRTVNDNGDLSQGEQMAIREGYVIEQEDIETWQQNTAYVVMTQMKTEKYITTVARSDLLEWELPERAAPLPQLSQYKRATTLLSEKSDSYKTIEEFLSKGEALL